MARKIFVVSACSSGWTVEGDDNFRVRMPQREQALLLARSAAHRAFLDGACSAVMLRAPDYTLTTEWLFGFESVRPLDHA